MLINIDLQTMRNENVGIQGKIDAKDQQTEGCGKTINHLREHFVDHAKNLVVVNVVMIVR